MEIFEYCSVRLEILLKNPIEEPEAYITITTDSEKVFKIKGVLEKVTDYDESYRETHRTGLETTVSEYKLKKSALTYVQPYLTTLGKDGWEVVEYKADKNFCEALLKRKVNKE